jgi:signal transduction histidine kinase
VKIRYKITLWIAGAGFFVSLLFSLIIFFEMKELPYKAIDEELSFIGQFLGKQIVKYFDNKDHTQIKTNVLPLDIHKYWIKIYDDKKNIIYKSYLVQYVDFPFCENEKSYTAKVTIPRSAIVLEQDDSNEVTFRFKTTSISVKGNIYFIQIGKPIEELDEDIVELIQSILVGLLITTLCLILLSYIIAGKVLKPIAIINNLAKEINDKTLDKRIPLGKHRDELYMLSASLNQMFDRLQYSLQRQKEFVANASHELKTPITLLLIFMENAIHKEDLPDKFRQRLIRHTDILRRMRRLVKNLLDLSILELKNSIELEELSLSESIRFVFEEYQEVFVAKNINLQVDIGKDIKVVGDKDKLQRCLINLVDNALKYNVEGGEIKVTLFEDGYDTVHLSLFNTGPGIPDDDLKRVFEQFYRVEKSRSIQYGGSGLGLCIVKRIIELHGGKIYIESEQGAWTRVHIILPKTRRG